MSGKERNCYGETRWNRYPDEESAFRKKKARAQTPPNSDPVLSQDLSLVPAPPVLEPAKLGALLSRPTVKLEPGILDAIKERRAELFAELLKEEPNTARSTKTASNFFSKWLRQYAKLPDHDMKLILSSDFLAKEDPWSLLHRRAFTLMTEIWVRGGEELRALELAFFTLIDEGMPLTSPDSPGERLRFDANKFFSQKTKKGDSSDFRLEFEFQDMFPNHGNPRFCLVQQYKDEMAFRKFYGYTNPAYFLALDYDKFGTPCDFVDRPLQIKVASEFVKTITTAAGCSNLHTNHDLRARGISDAYASGMHDQQVMAKSRHRSINAVRTYNKENITQQAAVSHTMHLRAAGIQVQHTDVVRALSANDRFATNRNVVAPLECTDNHIDNRVASAPAFTTPYDDPFLWDSAFLEEYDNTANGFW
ncbi:hypothetical protein CYMTET_13058 [Cymbomonas tetramitiformis]|uniref:Uncharacterized protein n=1 Tax=Cymbomonas tetramitiformis TaxID=36881 RepID=A0AAE0GJ76_9CHLO|nr:hypothetical protein CYMTET_13058 [Cymbomonas tetramitiformis]